MTNNHEEIRKWEKEFDVKFGEAIDKCSLVTHDGSKPSENLKSFFLSLIDKERERIVEDILKIAEDNWFADSSIRAIESYAKEQGIDINK